MDRRNAIKLGIVGIGGVASASSLQLLSSCISDAPPEYLFDLKNTNLMSNLVDQIIPETSSVSASQSGVVPFIDIALHECFKEGDQSAFVQGLEDLTDNGYEDLTVEEQVKTLQILESKEDKFFTLLKKLTLIGYFTSEEGIKQNYSYAPVPGKFEGCFPFKEQDKPWRGNGL